MRYRDWILCVSCALWGVVELLDRIVWIFGIFGMTEMRLWQRIIERNSLLLPYMKHWAQPCSFKMCHNVFVMENSDIFMRYSISVELTVVCCAHICYSYIDLLRETAIFTVINCECRNSGSWPMGTACFFFFYSSQYSVNHIYEVTCVTYNDE